MRGDKTMDNTIRLSSMTEALRGKNILQKHRIYSNVQRISGNNLKSGCSYGLVIPRYFDRALEILSNYNIHPVGRASGDDL